MSEPVVLTELRDDDSEVLFRWINDRELVLLSGAFEPVARANRREPRVGSHAV